MKECNQSINQSIKSRANDDSLRSIPGGGSLRSNALLRSITIMVTIPKDILRASSSGKAKKIQLMASQWHEAKKKSNSELVFFTT